MALRETDVNRYKAEHGQGYSKCSLFRSKISL